MTAELPTRKQNITAILYSDEAPTESKLIHLSDLNTEDMEFFKQAWLEADPERHYQVISQLIHLSEVDFTLDFTAIFTFCLQATDATVRIKAIDGLELEENYHSISPLTAILKDDSSNEVRAAAATALGKFAMQGELGNLSPDYTDTAYKALLEAIESNTETTEVRRRALESISPLNLPKVKDSIKEAYHSDDIKLKASSIYAMGRNCDLSWLTILMTELSSKEAEIRYEAVNSCSELGSGEAVPHLIKLVDDEDVQIQEAAIKALGEIGSENAEQALRKLLQDSQERIRETAKSALKELHFCEDPISLNL